MFDFPPWLLVEFCQFNRRAIDMPSQAASLQTQTIPPRRHIQAGGSPETNVNSGHPSRVDLDNARNYHGVGLLACGDIAPCTGRLRTIGRGHPRQGRMGIALGGPLGCDRTVCQGRRLDARGALTRTFGVERIEFWNLRTSSAAAMQSVCSLIGQKLLLIVAANKVPYF